MNYNPLMNRILPAAGVRRNLAEGIRARSPCEHDDDVPLNPNFVSSLGRGAADGCRRTNALLRCKKSTSIATMNVRTIREDWSAKELVDRMRK